MTSLEQLLPEKTSTIAKDLKLNLKHLLEDGALAPADAALALLAVATSLEDHALASYARERAARLEVPPDQIIEAAESAAIMGMLNVYYRFRHMLSHGQGEQVSELYKTAGLRMTALARPALQKIRFEMMALAVSVLNGCESCINAHEQALRDSGVEPNQIHDLARLAAVVKGLKTLSRS